MRSLGVLLELLRREFGPMRTVRGGAGDGPDEGGREPATTSLTVR
jgi:hypothetical protein